MSKGERPSQRDVSSDISTDVANERRTAGGGETKVAGKGKIQQANEGTNKAASEGNVKKPTKGNVTLDDTHMFSTVEQKRAIHKLDENIKKLSKKLNKQKAPDGDPGPSKTVKAPLME